MNKIVCLFLLSFNLSAAQVDGKALLLKIRHHHPKDTLDCFWLNRLIEDENDNTVWIQYNQQLKDIAVAHVKQKSLSKPLRYTYSKYLSIAYNNQGAYYNYNGKYQQAIANYQKSFQVSSAINFNEGNSLALQNIGTAYDFLGKLDSALVYFKKAYFFAKRSRNKSAIAYVLTDLGYVYNNLGSNALAIEYNLKAMAIFEKGNDDTGKERASFAIGRIFDTQKEYKKSIEYYTVCLKINQKLNDAYRQALVMNSLANVYIHLKDVGKAEAFLEKAKSICLKINYEEQLANTYKLYGDLESQKKSLDKAYSYYSESEKLYQQQNAASMQQQVIIELAKINLAKNNIGLAEKQALSGYENSKKAGYPNLQKNAAELLSLIFSRKTDFKKALYYKDIASKIAEETYFDEKNTIALKATYQYEDEKKAAKIKALAQEKKISELNSRQQKMTIYSIIAIVLVLGLLSYFMFVRYKTNQQNEMLKAQLKAFEADKKAAQSELKALRSQMNPHFIFNALNSIQAQFMFGDKILANKQMSNFTALTRDILEVSGQKSITLETEIEILSKYLELEKMRFKDDFSYTIHCGENIDEEYHQIPPMLIQPFVENSLKHGLLHKEGPKKLAIRFDLEANEEFLTCIIEDNGVGRKKSAAINAQNHKNHNSFSTGAVSQRLHIIQDENPKGELVQYEDLTAENGTGIGTRVTVRIPLV